MSKEMLEHIEKHKPTLAYNESIFEILEGNLLKYIQESLMAEFSTANAKDAMNRCVPINVLIKITDKRTQLYRNEVVRTTENPANQKLIDYYVEELNVNHAFNNANYNFNAYKNSVLEIYEDNKFLMTRSMPSQQFLPRSTNKVNPLVPTEIAKTVDGDYWVVSDEIFYTMDNKGKVLSTDENPYGVIPFTYINKSEYSLIPTIDTDTVKMTVMVPKLLTDINFGAKYQNNPIVYGVDIQTEGLERSPNVLWNVKSGGETDATPEINVVKADADLAAQMQSVMDQLSVWLQTRNIKPGAVGKVSVEQASSGVALIIQEMDTTNDVKSQKKYFEKAENDYWKRLGKIHNYFASNGQLENNSLFVNPEKMKVKTEYAEIKPVEDRATVIKNEVDQVNGGLRSKRKAIKNLNPKMDDGDIEKELAEIKTERSISFEVNPEGVEQD